jgi:predicted ester cyclase
MSGSILKEKLAAFIHEVWDCGDVGAASRYVAKVYTIHHDPGDAWEGRALDLESFRSRVRQSRAPFPDQKFDIQRMCEDRDAVSMTWLWRATHLADIQGFSATGKTIHMSGSTTYFFTPKQRLSGHWQITDRLGVLRQLQSAP